MEEIRCSNPRCRRRILENEIVDSEWTVLEALIYRWEVLLKGYVLDKVYHMVSGYRSFFGRGKKIKLF